MTLAELMAISDFAPYPPDEGIGLLGQLIDAAEDAVRVDALQQAIAACQELLSHETDSVRRALLHYFESNAWSALARAQWAAASVNEWDWQSDASEHQIIALRRAAGEAGFAQLQVIRQCQVFTNLGNLMDQLGRFVDAIAYWDRAIALDPDFGMAVGNRGMGLAQYSDLLPDHGHGCIFRQHALADLRRSLDLPAYPDALRHFFETYQRAQGVTRPCAERCWESGGPLGRSDAEKAYRRWCLNERLFLHPVNDLGPFAFAARDILSLPSMLVPLGAGPAFPGLYSQLKQEYVSARYFYFEGVTAGKPHFSDRDVRLYNTLDYPVYSLAAEKVKIAFRMAYSLFDKLAYFLNAYLHIGMNENQVNFRRIWYAGDPKKGQLRQEFRDRPNLPLRGLFGLSKDLFEDDTDYRESLEPLARELAAMRNHLEHKYLKLHEFGPPTAAEPSASTDDYVEATAYSVGRSDFQAGALRLLKLARAALIYLTLAIHVEEQQRAARRLADKRIPSMPLDLWRDSWKI